MPISFVSDHSETLVELDIDYKKMALSLGVKDYLRVPALNSDGHFISALAEICEITMGDFENSSNSVANSCGDNKNKGRICPKKFVKCPNLKFCET